MQHLKTFAAAGLIAISGICSAAQLSILPDTGMVEEGGIIDVDVIVLDLGNLSVPSLGAFIIDIDFDDSILAYQSVTYGSFLGDPDDPAETFVLTTTAPGTVGLSLTSQLASNLLVTGQPDIFSLATLSFSGVAIGESDVGFGLFVDLSDQDGQTLTVTGLNTAAIEVVPESIPLPATAMLLLSGIVLMRRRRGSHLRAG